MAFASTTHTASFSLTAFVARMNDTVKTYFARRAAYNQTVAELSSLSDYHLADLGLTRQDIHRIAREHALAI